ncbi:MAG TPA: zinc-dependent metalloprotease family protein, partial [Chryseolinea sp.]|nr:zinc-dependent metalloprotease family protein [Chryseolinea sp.]
MKQLYLVVSGLFLLATTAIAQQNPWQRLSGVRSNVPVLKNKITLLQPKLFELNVASLRSSLAGASKRNARVSSNRVVSFPNETGKLEKFSVVESSNMDPVLATKYPDIKSYIGKGVEDPTQSIYFSLSPRGLQTMLIRPGKPTLFIEPYTEDKQTYVVYSSGDREKTLTPFECKVKETAKTAIQLNANLANRPNADDGILRTYRVAISCTGEYSQYFGGTTAAALAGINATLTRINGIFETDFGVHLNLIANNEKLIYLDPAADPYASPDLGNLSLWNAQLPAVLSNVVGSQSYDVGHLFAGEAVGGNAGSVGWICVDPENSPNNNKGNAYSAFAVPEGDLFEMQYVAHEFGHQFGASHVFSHTPEYAQTQIEPGVGTSIMSYRDPTTQVPGEPAYGAYFNAISIRQIMEVVKRTSCQVNTATGNAIPTANAGPDYTIPKSTAFI